MLVSARKLPDTDAIFFFTHEELGRFIEAREPGLVRRALHRRRLHPQKMALEFPRVSMGKPRPIEGDGEPAGDGDTMHGTPVSRGVALGPARVARTIEEAKGIEPGEILVVPFTDVGWAPYFVLAVGLASEIGGMLSHGAVVAREFGLPAVVNLTGATKRFRTGDIIAGRRDDGRGTAAPLNEFAGSPAQGRRARWSAMIRAGGIPWSSRVWKVLPLGSEPVSGSCVLKRP